MNFFKNHFFINSDREIFRKFFIFEKILKNKNPFLVGIFNHKHLQKMCLELELDYLNLLEKGFKLVKQHRKRQRHRKQHHQNHPEEY